MPAGPDEPGVEVISRTRRGIALGAVAATLATAGLASAGHPSAAAPSSCPDVVDEADFADSVRMRHLTKTMDDFGPRPTASPAQLAYIDTIERDLGAIAGLEVSELSEDIDLQLDRPARLRVDGGRDVAVAGAVPYSEPTRGVTGELRYVDPQTSLDDVDVKGAIVIRDAATGGVPYAAFAAVAYFVHDPDLTINPADQYERDNFGYLARVADLEDAAEGGAAGVVFVHGFPHDQVQGQYAPYEGVRWEVPAVYVGADQGAVLVEAAREKRSATLAKPALQRPATTRNLVATLPGQTAERVVIQSHTDGMNAVWDNGPAAMLALAEYFAALPLECRTRTVQFVFTTAHLHLTESGAYRFAEILDEEYESGTVALVVALEHLGAKEFAAVDRSDGPGRRLEATGRSELFVTFSIESPVLVEQMTERITARDLRRTVLLRGADVPQVGFPPHRSYGGEGGPYREHLVPTIAGITGPWTLYNPEFELDELVDFDLMRRQTLAYADVILGIDEVPAAVLAGADTAYRIGRDVVGEQESHQPSTSAPADDGHAHLGHGPAAGTDDGSGTETGAATLPATGSTTNAALLLVLVGAVGVVVGARRIAGRMAP